MKPRLPRRRLLAPVAVVAAALVVASCASDPEVAATVNGNDIPQRDLLGEIDAIAGNDEYREALEEAGLTVQGSRPGAYDIGLAVQLLDRRIRNELVAQEVARRDVDVADECHDVARDDVIDTLGQGEAERGERILDAFPEDQRNELIDNRAETLALQAHLSDQGCSSTTTAEDYFAAHADEFSQACLSVITVATEDEADAIRDELERGADFATIASQQSIDSVAQQGGDAGCVGRNQFGPDVEELTDAVFAAEPGELIGPVTTAQGSHVAVVSEFVEPTLDEVRAEVEARATTAAGEALSSWFEEAYGDADISVDDRFGSWSDDERRVVAPEGTTGSTTSDDSGSE